MMLFKLANNKSSSVLCICKYFGKRPVKKESLLMRTGSHRLQELYYNDVQLDLMIKQFEVPTDEQLQKNSLLKEIMCYNPTKQKTEITNVLEMKSVTDVPFKVNQIPWFLKPPPKTPEQKQNESELKKIVTFRSIPKIEKIALEIECLQALKDKYLLASTFLILQSITGCVGETLKSKTNDASIMLRVGNPIGCQVELKRQDRIYEFLDKLTELVIPKIKQFNNGLSSNACIDEKGQCTITIDGRMLVHFAEVQSVYESLPILNDLKIRFTTNCESRIHTAMLLKALKLPINIEAEITETQQEETTDEVAEEIAEPTEEKKEDSNQKKSSKKNKKR